MSKTINEKLAEASELEPDLRFTQIATGTRMYNGKTYSLVYALGDDGQVYQYVFGKGWLTMEEVDDEYQSNKSSRPRQSRDRQSPPTDNEVPW